jgi:hypothetical protein
MTAPKTKTMREDENEHGVQLIVFAPANAKDDDEFQKIYMVCPAQLRVVEVVEKYGEDAENYLMKLATRKEKSSLSPKTFIEDISDSVDDNGTLVTDEDFEALNGVPIEGINRMATQSFQEELDDDIVAFASGSLGDIFPVGDDGEEESVKVMNPHEMDDMLSLLDQEDDDSDLTELTNSDGDDLDSLPEL